jgi:Family of unknown function (DUF6029)
MKRSAILFFILCASVRSMAQGTFSGDLMMNLNFFQRDTTIKASGNPLYDNYLSGSEGWLGLRYNIKGYTFSVRADAFNNSNLKNPTSASTDFGIGAWSINKEMKDLSITVGSIYDQVGSGILFRSYEDRGLLIDNALVGIELKYKINKHLKVKGFTGQQKNNSAIGINGALHTPSYGPVIKGLGVEGDFKAGKAHFMPGVAVLNRTLDGNSYQSIENNITSQYNANPLNPHFTPVYNMYAYTVYNTLTYKNLSWYAEGAYKTHEAIAKGVNYLLYDVPGNIEYTSINYGKKGLAISITGKRTENFVMRTSPNEILTNGMLNWQPVVAIQRPERLISRYTPASQDLSEMAGTANVFVAPNEATSITGTATIINTLNNEELYREGFAEYNHQGDKWIVQLGVQYLEYNLELYYNKYKIDPILKAITPFAEITYRVNPKNSFRCELQYMSSKQDYGSWVFFLLEYDMAPKLSISASDMYNITPNTTSDNPNFTAGAIPKANHYYNVYVAYTKGANRFSIGYVKQVDGMNCAGGVCRYEPAFSGVKATITSSF